MREPIGTKERGQREKPMDDYVRGKDKNHILGEMVGTARPGSAIHEQQKMGIVVRATEDIENALAGLQKAVISLEVSMNANARSSDNLAQKVFWLNVALTGATIVGTLIAAFHWVGLFQN